MYGTVLVMYGYVAGYVPVHVRHGHVHGRYTLMYHSRTCGICTFMTEDASPRSYGYRSMTDDTELSPV